MPGSGSLLLYMCYHFVSYSQSGSTCTTVADLNQARNSPKCIRKFFCQIWTLPKQNTFLLPCTLLTNRLYICVVSIFRLIIWCTRKYLYLTVKMLQNVGTYLFICTFVVWWISGSELNSGHREILTRIIANRQLTTGALTPLCILVNRFLVGPRPFVL